jgi:hypothetical protein
MKAAVLTRASGQPVRRVGGAESHHGAIDTSETTAYPAPSGRMAVDVAVLGGGITRVAVAAHLKRVV